MALDYNKLNSYIPLTESDFINQYRANPSNSAATQYYNELANQAHNSGLANVENYAGMAKEVTSNNGSRGEAANGFAETSASDAGVNFKAGSDAWLKMQYQLMRSDLSARKDNGGDLSWSQIDRIHTDAFGQVGLGADTWTTHTPLNIIAAHDPARADAIFNQLTKNSDWPAELLIKGYVLDGNQILLGSLSREELQEWAKWNGDMVRTYKNHPELISDLIDPSLRGPVQDLVNFAKSLPYLLPYVLPFPLNELISLPLWMQKMVGLYNDALLLAAHSPLVLDLDGDGIELTSLSGTGAAPVYFDENNDGMAEASAWVKSDDGLLVLDRNNNGKIDNQSEFFGFDSLRALDNNKDNAITAADANYAKLRVWRDFSQKCANNNYFLQIKKSVQNA